MGNFRVGTHTEKVWPAPLPFFLLFSLHAKLSRDFQTWSWRSKKGDGAWALVSLSWGYRKKQRQRSSAQPCKVSVTQNRPSSNAQFPFHPSVSQCRHFSAVGLNSDVTSEEHFFATLLKASLSTFHHWWMLCAQHSSMLARLLSAALSSRLFSKSSSSVNGMPLSLAPVARSLIPGRHLAHGGGA